MHFTGEIYVADNQEDKILGHVVQENSRRPKVYDLAKPGNEDPTGIWASGWVMWVADREDKKLYGYDMHPDRVHMPEWDVSGITENPAGIWSNYRYIYVLDSIEKAIYAYLLPTKYNVRLEVSGPTSVEYPENSVKEVASYSASSPQHLYWSLVSSEDRQHFNLSDDGKLRFKTPPDFEESKDDNGDNVYELVIEVSIGSSRANQPQKVTHYPVKVTVTDVEGEQPYFTEETTTRGVAENTPAGIDIGEPVTAVNPDEDDVHFYSLSGTDAASFDFSTSTGQIITRASLDYETKRSYSLTVGIRDDEDESGATTTSTNTDDTIQVNIEVTDVGEGPTVNGASTFDHPEGQLKVGEFTSDDPSGRRTTWETLSGDDGGKFSFSNGSLSFMAAPDYESPTDSDGSNSYEVTITVRAGNETGSLDVTVYVDNVNEAPTFSGTQTTRTVAENTPAGVDIGDPVTATDVDDHDTLYYELGGEDASVFGIDGSAGQIFTNEPLDYETTNSYNVTVVASDLEGATTSINVRISVTNANDQPEFSATESGQRSVVENLPNAIVGEPVAATDQDGDQLTYELIGGATSTFSIDSRTGQLTTGN